MTFDIICGKELLVLKYYVDPIHTVAGLAVSFAQQTMRLVGVWE
jgi:hypothetical protein